jgi:hypothetical protein
MEVGRAHAGGAGRDHAILGVVGERRGAVQREVAVAVTLRDGRFAASSG